MRSRVEAVGTVRLIPGKSKKRSDSFEGPGPRNGTLRDAKVKSRSFSLYSSRFEEKLASDCKLLTYLGITFIESHRERVKRSLSVVTPL